MSTLIGVLLLVPAAQAAADTEADAAAGDRAVAVVAGHTGAQEGFKPLAEMALALRAELRERGRTTVNPTEVLETKGIVSPDLLLQAEKEYNHAVAAYDGLEFAKAVTGFQGALKLLREAVRQGADPEKYVKALHYLAAATFFSNDRAAAVKFFREAYIFDPETPPNDRLFPPDVVAIYNEARESAQGKGALRVDSVPVAEVHVNGEARGVTPMTVESLSDGTYLLRLQSPGYEPSVQWVTVEDGQTTQVRSELKETAQLASFQQSVAEAVAELRRPRPGAAVARLQAMLAAGSVILVVETDKGIQTTWAENGFWVKQIERKVAEGERAAYVEKFLAAGPPLVKRSGCSKNSDCAAGKRCSSGKCVAAAVSTPIYKKWWFWTIVGAVVVAGATTGAVVGSQGDTWNAEVLKMTR